MNDHILAITQAICLYRKQQKIDGPLFLGMDTHALSLPALASALEVLAANGVEVMIADKDEYTPTPVISHAILYLQPLIGRQVSPTGSSSRRRIIPRHDGGFKYNPPKGGPAETDLTDWIEAKSNEFLERNLRYVKRIPFEEALHANDTPAYDYLDAYM
jgi:phosphoglucomutase